MYDRRNQNIFIEHISKGTFLSVHHSLAATLIARCCFGKPYAGNLEAASPRCVRAAFSKVAYYSPSLSLSLGAKFAP